jgi:hypothetical protein
MSKAGEASHSALETEILGEKAAALGHSARRVEAALAALPGSSEGEERERALDRAAELVWGFFVQRELLGLIDQETIVADYNIPREVLSRTGSMKPGRLERRQS